MGVLSSNRLPRGWIQKRAEHWEVVEPCKSEPGWRKKVMNERALGGYSLSWFFLFLSLLPSLSSWGTALLHGVLATMLLCLPTSPQWWNWVPSGLYLWSHKPFSCHPRYLSQGYASYIICSPAVFSFAIVQVYLQSFLISHLPHILILRFYFWLSSTFVLYYSCLDFTTLFTLLNNFTRPCVSLLPRTPYFQNFLLFSSLSIWCSGPWLTTIRALPLKTLLGWVTASPPTHFHFFWLLLCFGRFFLSCEVTSCRRSSFWVTSHLSQNCPGPLSWLVYGSVQGLVAMPRVQEWFAVCKWWQIFNISQVDRILLILWERHVRMQCLQSLLSYTLPQLLLSIPQSLFQLHIGALFFFFLNVQGKSN